MKAFAIVLGWLLASFGMRAGAESVTAAGYADPVDRYGHFALGRPHEYGRLVASTQARRRLEFALPQDEVFEDLEPRLIKLAAGAPQEVLAIASHRERGSRIVVIGAKSGRLEVSAESPAIGTPNRWLNPVGVADLDGDGLAEIAAVITPHIGGTLKIYRRAGRHLVEIAALEGFSNHAYGSSELRLSLPIAVGGEPRLLVPDATRLRLRVIALRSGRLVEVARCVLPAPVSGPILAVSPSTVSIGLQGGIRHVAPKDCPPPSQLTNTSGGPR